jgi:hypothetical protein
MVLQEHTKNDIESYARELVRKALSSTRYIENINFKDQVLSRIIEKANGVFLWVHLVGNELQLLADEGERPGAILDFLNSLPADLESYYAHMFKKLLSSIHSRGGISDGIRMLQFCLFSHRAIRLVEMEHALAISGRPQEPAPDPTRWEEQKPGDIKKRLLHCAGSFLETQYNLSSHSEGTCAVLSVDTMFSRLKHPHHQLLNQ